MEVWINSRLLLALGLAVSDAAQVYYLTPDARECMDRLKSSGMYRCVFRPQFCVLCFSRSTISMAGREFRIIWLKARVICSDPRSDGSLKRCSWRKQNQRVCRTHGPQWRSIQKARIYTRTTFWAWKTVKRGYMGRYWYWFFFFVQFSIVSWDSSSTDHAKKKSHGGRSPRLGILRWLIVSGISLRIRRFRVENARVHR